MDSGMDWATELIAQEAEANPHFAGVLDGVARAAGRGCGIAKSSNQHGVCEESSAGPWLPVVRNQLVFANHVSTSRRFGVPAKVSSVVGGQ